MLKNIFKKRIDSITVAAALVAMSSLVSRLLGVLRDRILAGKFGAGQELDIYYAAFKAPDLVYNLIVLGALSAGFIPVFTKLIKDFNCEKKNKEDAYNANKEAWLLASKVLTILFFILSIFSVLGCIFSLPLVKLIAPGFDIASQKTTSVLTKIMFLSPLFLGLSGIFGGILQSFKRFLVYSLAPIFYNLGIIISALYFVDVYGLTALAWGVVFGAFLHLIVQVPTVFSLGFRFKISFSWRDKNILEIFKVMIPRMMSLAVSQVNLIVITALASGLSSGSLTIFNLANNLQSFPVGIFGISFAVAAFPVLSSVAFNKDKLAEKFSQAFRQILFFIVPATVLIITLRAQIVRVILGSGNFSWRDTVLTMDTLAFFSLSLFAQATIPLLVRAFYARHNSKLPLYLSLVTVGANVFLSLIFSKKMGVTGLALAFSLSSILNFLLLFLFFSLETGAIKMREITIAIAKFSITSIIAGFGAQVTKYLVWPYIDMTKFSGVFIQLVSAGLIGTLFYALASYALKGEEFMNFVAALKRSWPFKKVKIGDQGEARGL